MVSTLFSIQKRRGAFFSLVYIDTCVMIDLQRTCIFKELDRTELFPGSSSKYFNTYLHFEINS